MIAYDLECSHGHNFEGWFENSESFETQKSKNMISCPLCEDTDIRKLLSPVTVRTATESIENSAKKTIDYKRLAKELVDQINKNFDDVGSNFTKEALKMHYNVTEKKNIRGTATENETKILEQEGIQFFRLPIKKSTDD